MLQLSNKRFLLDDNINFVLQLLTNLISFRLEELVVVVKLLKCLVEFVLLLL